MDIREKNAEYDDFVGDIYNKCEWCQSLILSVRYMLEKKIEGIDYKLFFCSVRCRKMALWSMKQHKIRNVDTDTDSYKYELLKKEMSKEFELLQRRRGY